MVNIVDGIRRMARIMSGKDENPTGVTAAQLGTYSKEEVNAKLDGLVSSVDMRLSQYGDTSFLPVNVSGSFEGSATGFKAAACFREHDGRVYLLRNGSDGRFDGAYYAEVELGANGAINNCVATSIPYHPPFIPDGWRVTEVCGGYKDQLAGRIQNEEGKYKTFIAYTGYTMNQSLHTGIIIEKHGDIDGVRIFEEGGTVFFVHLDSSDRGVKVVVRKIYTKDLSSDLMMISPWSGTGLNSKVYSAEDNIRLTDVLVRDKSDTSVNSYSVLLSGNNALSSFQTWPQVEIYHLGGSRFRVIFGHETWSSHKNGEDRIFITRQIDMDVSNATYEVHPSYRSSVYQSVDDNGKFKLITTDRTELARNLYDGGWDGNIPGWVTCTPDGLYMAYRAIQANSVNIYVEWGKSYNKISDLTQRDGSRKVADYPLKHQFGTAIQAPLFSPNVYDNDSMVVTNYNSTIMYSNMAGWFPTEEFRLPDGEKTKIIPLNSNRKVVKPLVRPNATVVEIIDDVVYRHSALFWENKYSGFTDIPNLEQPGTGHIEIPGAVFAEIQQRAVDIAKANNGPLAWYKTYVLVTQHSRLPPYAITFFGALDEKIYQVRQELDFGGVKSGVLNTPTTTKSQWDFVRNGGRGIDINESANYHGIHIADYPDFTVQGGCGVINAKWVGNGGGLGVFGKWKNGNYTIVYRETSQPHTTDTPYPLPLPKIGVVLLGVGRDRKQYNCNLSGITVGKGEADIDDLENRRGGTANVFFTSAVVNGWVVYFTEEIPVTIGNVSGKTIVQSIDLKTVFGSAAANRKFSVYVRLQDGVFDHVIGDEPTSDPNHLFVGYVYTNNDGIRSIEVDKVIGINGYAISTSKRGTAIAATDGNPNGPGSFKWK